MLENKFKEFQRLFQGIDLDSSNDEERPPIMKEQKDSNTNVVE